MSDPVTISELPGIQFPEDADVIPIESGGVTQSIRLDQIAFYTLEQFSGPGQSKPTTFGDLVATTPDNRRFRFQLEDDLTLTPVPAGPETGTPLEDIIAETPDHRFFRFQLEDDLTLTPTPA